MRLRENISEEIVRAPMDDEGMFEDQMKSEYEYIYETDSSFAEQFQSSEFDENDPIEYLPSDAFSDEDN